MERATDEITGFIQNVSPLGQGQTKKYFDFQVQTGTDVVRAVCFSPSKRKAFDEASMKKSPVKIRKFMLDKKEGSTDILMNDKVQLDELDSVDFERREIVPQGLTISGLLNIMPEQLIDLKAKVISLQKPSTVKANTDNPLRKQEGLLIDPTGSIKVILWELDVDQVEEGQAYFFRNLRLKKNKLSGDLYVNPAKDNSKICPSDAFPSDSLKPPQSIPLELVISTITGEVIAVNKSSLNFCCFRCHKTVEILKDKIIAYCRNCGMKLKFAKCVKKWYVSAVVSDDTKNITLNFYDDVVTKILETFAADSAQQEDEDLITDIFFGLPTITYTYNEKTRSVQDVSVSCQ